MSSLKSFVQARSNGPELEQRARILLGNDIKAVNLNKLSGISIDWTHDLENHLLYDRDRKILKVYRLEHVIQAHKTRYTGSSPQARPISMQIFSGLGIIPERLINETIESLHLLFSTWDPRTKIYLRKLDQGHFSEIIIDTCRQIYTTDFYYWHDQLAELSHESQPPPSAPLPALSYFRMTTAIPINGGHLACGSHFGPDRCFRFRHVHRNLYADEICLPESSACSSCRVLIPSRMNSTSVVDILYHY